MSVDVIVPTRNRLMDECWEGIELNKDFIRFVFPMIDYGIGQIKMRLKGARMSNAEYVLFLDDDVKMRKDVVLNYLYKIEEGWDAVCGETNVISKNGFSKHILKYGTNPSTDFYAVGCTLWRRKKFIEIMKHIPKDTSKYLHDVGLQKLRVKGVYHGIKMPSAVSDHIKVLTAQQFFMKRLDYGVAIGEMFSKDRKLPHNLLKFIVGVPLSKGRGEFLYRLATLLGMMKYVAAKS